MRKLCIISLIFGVALLHAQESRLFRQPTVSATHIAFAYGGDLWVVERSGGMARKLTSAEGVETEPRFSPDGRWIAFTGQYDSNTDVFIVPSVGGEPKRLTFHPGADIVRGWTLDGKSVVFSSFPHECTNWLSATLENFRRRWHARAAADAGLARMMGELVIGHSYIQGVDAPTPMHVQVGLLGVDYTIENNFYRIAKIYTGENWNPDLRAPLTEPGINVSAGDSILAVNGSRCATR